MCQTLNVLVMMLMLFDLGIFPVCACLALERQLCCFISLHNLLNTLVLSTALVFFLYASSLITSHPAIPPTHVPHPQAPSISALFCAKYSLNHLSGFSGSSVARFFIASSKCGVTC